MFSLSLKGRGHASEELRVCMRFSCCESISQSSSVRLASVLCHRKWSRGFEIILNPLPSRIVPVQQALPNVRKFLNVNDCYLWFTVQPVLCSPLSSNLPQDTCRRGLFPYTVLNGKLPNSLVWFFAAVCQWIQVSFFSVGLPTIMVAHVLMPTFMAQFEWFNRGFHRGILVQVV